MSMSTFHRFASLLLAVFLLATLGAVPARGGGPVARANVLHYIEHEVNSHGLDGAISVAVSPDGKHVYVAGYTDDAIVVFARDSAGELSFVQVVNCGATTGDLDGPMSIAISPDGKHVYVASYVNDALVVYSRDEASGVLTFVAIEKDGVGGVEGLDGARSVVISPTGGRVYVVSTYDGALAVFFRNAATGELTFWQVLVDGVNGVDGLGGARSVAVSPDGKNIYVAGWNDDAVAIFEWGTIGPAPRLYFKGLKQDGVGGVDGLKGAHSVVVSPDGEHVYVAGESDDAVAAFARNSVNGGLTFVGATVDGVGGVDGLDGAVATVVSPDGEYVYVASWNDNALVVLSRDSTTGLLTFVEAEVDGIGGVDGLQLASGVAVSPDGRYVYVTGSGDDAVAVFGLLRMVYIPVTLENH